MHNMRSSMVTGLLATGAAAFSNSSPFLLYSTVKLDLPFSYSQLQTTSQVFQTTSDLVASCPTDTYLIHTQPNAHASDLRDSQSGECLAPSLCAFEPYAGYQSEIKSTFGVAEVLGGDIDVAGLKEYIEKACAKAGKSRQVSVLVTQHDVLPRHGEQARKASMQKTDKEIDRMLNYMTASRASAECEDCTSVDYTFIYLASPHEPPRQYESDYVESTLPETELRRRQWADQVMGRAEGNSTLPLFVKYQFFTPGLFMAFIGALIMFAMLYVGLSAVASLEVSYGAFDKEMGPAAQKKNL